MLFHWALCTHRKQINYPSVSHLFVGRCIIFWLELVFLIGFCLLWILLIAFVWSLYLVEVFQRIIKMVVRHVVPFGCQCTQDEVVYRGCLIGWQAYCLGRELVSYCRSCEILCGSLVVLHVVFLTHPRSLMAFITVVPGNHNPHTLGSSSSPSSAE